MQGIPQDLYEAASIDGAGAIARFWRITVPLISPATFFVLVISLISSFQVFDQVYLLFWRDQSNASPDSALFYAVYLFQQAFQQFNFGFAAAMAWLLFLILVVLTFIQVKVGNRFVYYEGGK